MDDLWKGNAVRPQRRPESSSSLVRSSPAASATFAVAYPPVHLSRRSEHHSLASKSDSNSVHVDNSADKAANYLLLQRIQSAQHYIQCCDFTSATASYEACIDVIKARGHRHIHTVLQFRMQLAIIKTMRGQWIQAEADFLNLRRACQDALGTPITGSKPDTRTMIQNPQRYPETAVQARAHLASLDRELIYHLAVVRVRQGRFDLAIRELTDMDPGVGSLAEPGSVRQWANSRRLLGLAHAYVGHYSQALKYIEQAEACPLCVKPTLLTSTTESDGGEREASAPQRRGTRTTGDQETNSGLAVAVSLSKIKILMMSGQNLEALNIAELTIPIMEDSLGPSHLLTLETRYVRCLLFAKAGRLSEAKTQCLETMDAMVKHLDQDHPFILEVSHALAEVYRLQACPSEAVTLSEDLYRRARRLFGIDSQQALRYEFQNASLNLWVGNRTKGLQQLSRLYPISKAKWGHGHPWTLACGTEYCLALSLSGRASECREELEDIFQHHARPFALLLGVGSDGSLAPAIINYLQSLASAGSTGSDIPRVHPLLLDTVRVWIQNEPKDSDARLHLAIKAQSTLLDVMVCLPSFGPCHIATLQVRLGLADMMRYDDEEAAEVHYRKILNSGGHLKRHPILLSAEQGRHICKALPEPDRPDHVIAQEQETDRFLAIPQKMGLRLGSSHPEVLGALLVAFTAAFYIDKDLAADMSADLRRRLESPTARAQRPIECLQMMEKLGLTHYRLGSMEEAAAIFNSLARQLRGEEETLHQFPEGAAIRMRLNEEAQAILEEACINLWLAAEKARKGGFLEEAVAHLRAMVGHTEAVHGKHDMTDWARCELAKALWDGGQLRDAAAEDGGGGFRKEAMKILRGLVDRKGNSDNLGQWQTMLCDWEYELGCRRESRVDSKLGPI